MSIVLSISPRRGKTTDRRAAREIRMRGSEGGVVQANAPSLPLSLYCTPSVTGGRNDDRGRPFEPLKSPVQKENSQRVPVLQRGIFVDFHYKSAS